MNKHPPNFAAAMKKGYRVSHLNNSGGLNGAIDLTGADTGDPGCTNAVV